MKTLAIIPARGGSKRLPGKNTLPLLGLPLVNWAAQFAVQSELFDHVILSTDSQEIADTCDVNGVYIPGLRPAELATDTATSMDVALHALDMAEDQFGEMDAVALLQPTNPFRRGSLWAQAFSAVLGGADGAIGVTKTPFAPHHSFVVTKDQMTPLFPDGLTLRGQDLPHTVYVNGSLYLVRKQVLRAQKTFFPTNAHPIQGDHVLDSLDIDTAKDFAAADRFGTDYKASVSGLLAL